MYSIVEESSPKKFWERNPKIGKALGTIFILIGFLSLVTPFTPLGFFFLLGIEFLGLRAKYWDKLKIWVDKTAHKI